MNNNDLIKEVAAGEKEAFMEIYRKYRDMVYRHCYSVTLDKEDARELFQEVWIKIYLALRRNYNIENFAGYLKTTIKNTVVDYFRKNSTYFDEELEEEISLTFNDPTTTIDIQELLKNISPEERYLVFLRFYEGYTTKEISDFLNISESAVKMRIHRLLKNLREKI